MAMQKSAKVDFLNAPVWRCVVAQAIIVVPLTLLLPRLGFGVLGVFMAEPISNVIGGLASYITMRLTIYRQVEQAMAQTH